MKQITVWFVVCLSTVLFADYTSAIGAITPQVKKHMIEGDSWRRSCPVGVEALRYVEVAYWDFRGKSQKGELIVHQSVAKEIVSIFKELYTIKYPIHTMRLVSHYKGSDWHSIEADNTSAFNCRNVAGTKKWSKHAYGKAIDINPIENPYISRKGHISHNASRKYRKRVHQNDTASDRAVLLKNDKATQIFKKYGWRWGGDWRTIKDYQHFVK